MDLLGTGVRAGVTARRLQRSVRGISRTVVVSFLLTIFAHLAVAQLSPGELSDAHAHLEGMTNCTSCHTIGKTLSREKCLACHTDLQARIENGRGAHARYGGKACVECHKEHHGRTFSIVHFDTKSFDHRGNTGFALEGKHAGLKCRQCHAPEFIRDAAVLKKGERETARTYQGLVPACSSCHADIHRGQLSSECGACHRPESWKPASLFVHDRARFTLTGEHVNVVCGKCHAPANDQPRVVRFRNIPFGSCASCHKDVHAGRFKEECANCHTTAGWRLARSKFNHMETRFPLREKHALVRCEQCHGGTAAGRTGKGFHIAQFQRCSDCHTDPHRGRFTRQGSGKTCESCHTETGWFSGPMKTFDHSRTSFPLNGRHSSLECTRCHGGKDASTLAVRAVAAARVGRCDDCHADPHAGQFAASSDCAVCHREGGFLPSLFSVEKHSKTAFPLDGSHEAVPCVRCHTVASVNGKNVRIFRSSTRKLCADCHKDPHEGKFARWSSSGCGSCHLTAAWASVRFAHEQTGYALDGKHRTVSCAGCHRVRGTGKGMDGWQFSGRPKVCSGCHAGTQTGTQVRSQ